MFVGSNELQVARHILFRMQQQLSRGLVTASTVMQQCDRVNLRIAEIDFEIAHLQIEKQDLVSGRITV